MNWWWFFFHGLNCRQELLLVKEKNVFLMGVLGFTVYWEQSVMFTHDLCPLVWCRFSISGPRFRYTASWCKRLTVFLKVR